MPIVGAPSTTAQVILDPVTEDAANVELDVSGGNYGLLAHAYPAPSIRPQWTSNVDSEGSLLSTVQHENRTVSLSVEVSGLGALHDLEAKVAKLYREGGTLKRVYSDGREIVFDVLVQDSYEPTFDFAHHFADVTTVDFTLICRPYGRGAKVTLADHVETTLPVLVFTEATIAGDVDALGELVADEDEGQAQASFIGGLEQEHYNAAASAALFWQAEACTMGSSTGAFAGPAPASGAGANTARCIVLGANTPRKLIEVGPTNLGVHVSPTHVGQFRVWARVYAPAANTGTVSAYASWQPNMTTSAQIKNPAVPMVDAAGVPIEDTWLLLDLGVVRAAEPPRGGGLGWECHIYAQSTIGTTTDVIYLDWILLAPTEWYGEALERPSNFVVPASGSAIVAWDGFHSTTGTTDPVTGLPRLYRPKYEGDYLLVPPSGAGNRTTRFAVKMARMAVSGLATAGAGVHFDTAIDNLSARLTITPRFLTVPA